MEQFFHGIAIVSTAILVMQIAMMLFGLGGETDLDMDGGGDIDMDHGHHGDGLGILSFRTVVAFLTGFGWIGVMSMQSGLGAYFALIPAAAAGIGLMLLIWWLMKVLSKLTSDGTLNYVNAIGEVGTVYLPIPPNRQAPGQIEVMIQGRLVVAQAFSTAEQRLENQSRVRVIDVMDDNSLVVQPV